MKKNADRAAPTKNARPVRRSPTAKARGARRKSRPKFDLTHALRRYADLYDLAPTGYVSFDRSGRIEEINLTAAQLDGMPRDRLIGMPFMTFIAREDASLFLHHLRRSRDSESRVETEMRLKNAKREIIHAYLSSAPISAAIHNGAVPYQTAIVDLTERKRAAQVRCEVLRQQAALYEPSLRHQEAKTLGKIYQATLDAILTALPCDRAQTQCRYPRFGKYFA